MASKFKSSSCNWTDFRQLPDLVEVDFHWSDRGTHHNYWESMEAVYNTAINALANAQKDGKKNVLFRHGSSTSRIGKTTARSQIRKAMLSKEATPFIIRSQSIQHETVFIASIRPLKEQDI